MAIFGGNKDFFGIDIGTTFVRVVQLDHTSSSANLRAYGAAPISMKMAHSDAQQDKEELANTIRKLLNDSKISTKNVVVGLSTNSIYTSIAEFQPLSNADLEKAIRYQAEQYIPVPLEDVKLDWLDIGQGAEGKKQVLLVAAQKKAAESRLNLLERLGLDVVVIEPDPIAMTRALLPPSYLNAAVVLDMGANATDLTIIYNGAPHLIRSIPVGGNSLVKAAGQNLGVDEKQANDFVFKFGMTKDKLEGQVFKALQSTVDTLVSEVQKSTKFFLTKNPEVQVEKIILTGGGSSLPQFPLYLANNTGMMVEIGNTWTNVGYNPNMTDTLNGISSQFAVATGLALRRDI